MIKTLLGLLAAPHPDPLTADDAELALAALLVRLARSDGRYDEAEQIRIDRILAARRGLGPFEATELRRSAEALEETAPDTVRFTRALKDKIAHDDRIAVIEAMWEVALADEARAPDEEAMIRLAASLLGISDRDSAFARQRVLAREG